MYGIGKLISLDLLFMDTLHFGAIVSATDPVTILAVFQVNVHSVGHKLEVKVRFTFAARISTWIPP
jgi:NhaP-type Na+/H+ or K+/H+ antiporter